MIVSGILTVVCCILVYLMYIQFKSYALTAKSTVMLDLVVFRGPPLKISVAAVGETLTNIPYIYRWEYNDFRSNNHPKLLLNVLHPRISF